MHVHTTGDDHHIFNNYDFSWLWFRIGPPTNSDISIWYDHDQMLSTTQFCLDYPKTNSYPELHEYSSTLWSLETSRSNKIVTATKAQIDEFHREFAQLLSVLEKKEEDITEIKETEKIDDIEEDVYSAAYLTPQIDKAVASRGVGLDPLSILEPCLSNDEKQPGHISTVVRALGKAYGECKGDVFTHLISDAASKYYVAISEDSPVCCTLCSSAPMTSGRMLMCHIILSQHIQKLVNIKASVSAAAYKFWKLVIEEATNGSVVPKGAVVSHGVCQNPLSILEPCEDDDKKQPGDISTVLGALGTAYKACKREVFTYLITDATSKYHVRISEGSPVCCNLCSSPPMTSGKMLMSHIILTQHIPKLVSMKASVSAAAYEFWKFVIEEATNGTTVIPKMDEEVSRKPLSILKPCKSDNMKQPGDVSTVLRALGTAYAVCKGDVFSHLISDKNSKYYVSISEKSPVCCNLCSSPKMTSGKMLMCHLFLSQHIPKLVNMKASVSAASYEFWKSLIEEATYGTTVAAKMVEQPGSLLRIVNGQVFPIVDFDPFIVLKATEPSVKLKYTEIHAAELKQLYKNNKASRPRLIDISRAMFFTHRYCQLCKATMRDAGVMINHISGTRHLKSMTAINHSYCADAFAFWKELAILATKHFY